MAEVISNSPDDTAALGKKIAGVLRAGSIVAVAGALGSGKTRLAKGIALGLGVTENITSPTYTIINEYQRGGLSPTLYHIDAYRLSGDKDFEDIGGVDIIHSGGISIIEWCENISGSIPANSIFITIELKGGSSRLIKIKGIDSL